ncbi:ATP-dependent Lon protease [Desulfosarcina sp. BuS5]|uniref:endopeptidase La n=1 Tax=Desulfosarcina sp. BuS5 TaxID=933262 RepID=UPI000487B3A0|nr:endopeptidase La [Desulfosarcina sp. BuS5]WDN89773.1 ATP-dependent Lon protease [Desulfosarcina sp. BuS5]
MAEADNDDLISLLEEEEKDIDLPNLLPLLAVRDVVVFPDMLLPLFVGRSISIRAVDEAVAKDGFILLVTQKKQHLKEGPQPDDLYTIGTIARILRILKLPDGRIKALIQGIAKAKIIKYVRKRSFYRVKSEVIFEKPVKNITIPIEALMRSVRKHSEKIIELKDEFSGDISSILESIESPGKLADLVASNLKLKIEESQSLLELVDPVKRLKKINKFLSRELELSSMQAKIQSDVRVEISKNQRDYFLREQVRAINKELGDSDDKSKEITEYKTKIKKAKMPSEAGKAAKKELKRLSLMHPDSAESSVIRTYLDWLVELPWSKSTKDNLDIKKAKEELNAAHHGLKKIKNRILENISVKKLNPQSKGQILCFAGPPGVGKTSLGQAISKAMGRKFIRISLGGIRDEAEIRGHRRTYIGALPGRILQGLKQCNTNNPVFMLDEIDKIGADFRGDPSSALLEALDPEQNSEFSDHYLNITFDLSKVMFILTANITDTIPSALFDRMEVINLTGYTEEEKQIIAEKFLIPRQITENGLTPKTLSISNGALLKIIQEYTMEAGLRNLEREIKKICRKIARKIAEGEKKLFQITQNNLHQYLGLHKYYPEMDKEESQVGLATGLAWTQVGGEVLYVESSLISGKGDLIITGQLGDVMQESARAAVSYTKANLQSLDIEKDFFENLDIHIHVPAGAIPKDGPSAGIVMAASLISSATGKPLNKDIAMTGEITLRGRVLPIGGLKEKALGALRAGINTIIIPEKNKKDIAELPANVKRKIKFISVKNMDEALSIVLEKEKNETKKTSNNK